MRIHIVGVTSLLLVFAIGALARSRYRRHIAGVGVTDKVSLDAGLDGANAEVEKGLRVKVPHVLSGWGEESKQGGSKEIGLGVKGKVGLKPKAGFEDGKFKLQLGGYGSGGFGISAKDGDKINENGGIFKGHGLEGGADEGVGAGAGIGAGAGAGAGLSLGLNGISAHFGGGLSADAGGHKHGYGEHHDHSESHGHHESTADSNGEGVGKVYWENKDDYSKEGKIIVIPISDANSDDNDNTYWISAGGTNSGGKDEEIIVLPHRGSSNSEHVSGSESHNSHGGIKVGIDGAIGGGTVKSHGDAGQSNSNAEHNNGNGSKSSHVPGKGGIIISHDGYHSGSYDKSKEYEVSVNVNGTKSDGKKKGDGSIHLGGGGSIHIEGNGHGSKGGSIVVEEGHVNHGKGGGKDVNVTVSKDGNSHIQGGGGIVISHGGHHSDYNISKEHQISSIMNGTKSDGRKEGSGSIHLGGGGSIHIGGNGHGSKGGAIAVEEGRINHGEDGGKDINVTISKDGDSHIQGGGGIVISHNKGHGGYNKSKEYEVSIKVNGTKSDGKKEGSGSIHIGGGGSIHIGGNEHGNKGGAVAGGGNINHGKGGGKDVNVSVGGDHGGSSGNSADGKESDSHKKDDDGKYCAGILDNGKCGHDIKGTLKFVQAFIHSCDAIIHFLLELKETDLHRVLCRVSPYDCKLSCQLGCNILRVRPLLD